MINVLVEESGFALAVLEDHEANAMLQTLVPIPAVYGTVLPVHLTVALLDVIDIVALVMAASVPLELSVAVLLVVLVATLVLIAVLVAALLPLSLSILLAIIELAHVRIAVGPGILTIALCLTVKVFTNVCVSDDELVTTLAMAKASFPLTFIDVSVGPRVLTESVRLVVVPLTCILVAFRLRVPRTVSCLLTLMPKAIIYISICPRISSLTVHATHFILTFEYVLVAENFEAHAMAFVRVPLSLVQSTRLVADDAFTFALSVYYDSTIDTIFIVFDGKVFVFDEVFPAEELWPLGLVI